MNQNLLHLVPRAEQDDDDFMEAVVEVGAQIYPPPPPPHSNVISFKKYVDNLDSLPVFIPFDEFGKPVWTR